MKKTYFHCYFCSPHTEVDIMVSLKLESLVLRKVTVYLENKNNISETIIDKF